jgi:hypothetical protein
VATSNFRLITPPKQEEEIYPYRRVWQSLAREMTVLIGVVVGVFVLFDILRLSLPVALRLPINLALATIPAILWFIFSYLAENRVPQPRPRIGEVFILSVLIASAIGIPFVQTIIQPEKWLATESTINRILGYTMTVGVVQEFLKYIILRYTVWQNYSTRADSIAYATTVAIGYATVLNFSYVLGNDALSGGVALRVLANTAMNVVGSLVLAYGLSETVLQKSTLFLLPATLFIASLLNGLMITLRSGIMNAQITLKATSPRPILSLGFSIVFYIALVGIMLFIYNANEKQQREALKSSEE